MKQLFWMFFAWFVISVPASAASGTMIKNDDLRASAASGSALVGRASKGATVEVLKRQGGWTQIKHAEKTGWVRILSVRLVADSGGNLLGGLAQLGGSRPDSRRVVAVAGLRGLNEAELRGARFNATELARLDQYVCSRMQRNLPAVQSSSASIWPISKNPSLKQKTIRIIPSGAMAIYEANQPTCPFSGSGRCFGLVLHVASQFGIRNGHAATKINSASRHWQQCSDAENR